MLSFTKRIMYPAFSRLAMPALPIVLANMLLTSMLCAAQAGAQPPGKAPTQAEAPPMDADKLAQLQRLFEVSGSKRNIHELIGGVLESMKPQIARGLPPGERSQQIATAVVRKLSSMIDSDEFFLHLAMIYDNFFTQEDVKDLITFYESPAGKHFAAVMPQMTQRFIRGTQQWIDERIPKMMEQILNDYPEFQQGSPQQRPGGPAL